MAITSPLSITWRDLTVGGSTVYPIAGPYMLERSYDRFLLVFNVLVTADDFATLVSRSTTLENTFGSRLGYDSNTNDLVISLDGNSFTYEHGKTIFNAEGTISKSGDPETDGPLSRLYTVRIQGETPEETGGGLREFEVTVTLDESRVHNVSMRGVYFAKSDGTKDAYTQYDSEFDSIATSYLNFVGTASDFELVAESYNVDRNRTTDSGSLPNPHKCAFNRQYREIIFNQVEGTLNDPRIVNNRMQFSNMGNFIDNGREDVQRLQRVAVVYDCALDHETNPDAKAIAEDVVIPYILSEFKRLYTPDTFCVEAKTAGFDPAQLRLSVSVTLAFVPSDAGDVTILDAQESVQYRETRTIDFTYVHGGGELDAYAAPGFGVKERVWHRQITCVGAQSAISRLFPQDGGGGPGGGSGGASSGGSTTQPGGGAPGGGSGPGGSGNPTDGNSGGGSNVIGEWTNEIRGEKGLDTYTHDAVQESGWNTVTSSSTVVPLFMGEVNGERIEKTKLMETCVQRFTKVPTTGTSGASGPSQ